MDDLVSRHTIRTVGVARGHEQVEGVTGVTDSRFGAFYVGGEYQEVPEFGTARVGQMYVEFHRDQPTEPYPIVFVHGGGSTGAVWLACPDGRPGWAPYFVDRGFSTYLVDWPGCGRSVYYEPIYGPQDWHAPVDEMERRFTDLATHRLWPQAHLHTQWPGTGRAGDAPFDAMMDSRGSSGPRNPVLSQGLTTRALEALLDRIGPAVIVTHSYAGHMGWAIADARPDAVKALVQLEPSGPPVYDITPQGEDGRYDIGAMSRPWGLTAIPVTYDPPVTDPSELAFVRAPDTGRSDRARCWLQDEPARSLPNIAKVPVLVVAAEASRHALMGHAVSEYLDQAGVDHTFLRLEDAGLGGNGHKFMSELNSDAIAEVVREWIVDAAH